MEQKRFLFITGTIFTAGAGKMLRHVAGLMAKEYTEVYAVSLGSEVIPETDDGVKYLQPLHVSGSNIFGQGKTIIALHKLISELKPDVVVPFVVNVVFCTRVATLTMRNVKVLGAERNDPYSYPLKWRILGKWAFWHCDWCFFQLEKARDFYGKPVFKKSTVIPNAAFFTGIIGCHHKEKKTIVSAGRFRKEKGFDLLISVFAKVHRAYPDYKLIIYGDGPLLSQYLQQVDEFGLRDFVLFPGYTFEISNALKNEGIFVLPSRAEGIPNVLIEALVVGIPTISCDCSPGGARFLLDSGKRGLLVPVDDENKLYDGIVQLIEDNDLYKKLELAGPGIIDVLRPDKIENEWISAFKKIIYC